MKMHGLENMVKIMKLN